MASGMDVSYKVLGECWAEVVNEGANISPTPTQRLVFAGILLVELTINNKYIFSRFKITYKSPQ